MKKILQIIAYYLAPLTFLIILFFFPEKEFLKFSGYVALFAIILVMFIKPAQVILGGRMLSKLVTLRREIGVLCFWAALLHGLGYLIRMDFSFKWENPALLWAYIGLILIFLLGITSNNISVRTLRSNWKRFQYLAYPALVVTGLHVELIKYNTIYITLTFTVFFVILKIWEKIKLKNKIKK